MPEPFAPRLRRKKLLGGAEESSPGTDVYSLITAALASTQVQNLSLDLRDLYSAGRREPHSRNLSSVTAVPGSRRADLRFTTVVSPGDRSLSMLTMAGMRFSGGIYSPTSDASLRKTWSFKLWEDGRVRRCYGVAADLVSTLKVGEPLMFEWAASGVFSDLDTDAAMPSNPTYAALPYVCRSITLTLGGAALPRVQTATIRLNNNVVGLESLTSTDGFAYFHVVSRRPQIVIDSEARLKAELDTYGLTTTPTEGAISIVLTRGSSTLSISAPKAQRVQVDEGERDGILLDQVTFDLNGNSGDDEITFTEF